MKTRHIANLLSALVIGSLLSLATAQAAEAAPDIQRTGIFGIARGQVARINAVNLSDKTIQVPMAFLDSNGRVIAHDTKTIAPGQAAFFDVVLDAAVGEANRASVRAVALTPPDPCRVSVEVFDNDTGRTSLLPAVQ